jgi:hypothetical protein
MYLKGSGRGLILSSYSSICLKGLRKITETFRDNRSSDRDLNPEPLEYEAAVLTTRPRRSVGRFVLVTYPLGLSLL